MRNEYLVAENRILKAQSRPSCSFLMRSGPRWVNRPSAGTSLSLPDRRRFSHLSIRCYSSTRADHQREKPIAQFKNVTLSGNCSGTEPVMDSESLIAAGAVESVESASYFPSRLRESAECFLFLSLRQSPRRSGWVTFLNCAMIYLRVTF